VAPFSSSSEYSNLKAIYLFIDILDDYLFMASIIVDYWINKWEYADGIYLSPC
jgi:hypothetical protein